MIALDLFGHQFQIVQRVNCILQKGIWTVWKWSWF